MSQNIWITQLKNGQNVDVQMGWDNPLSQYYLVIGRDMDEPVYSNITDELCEYTLEYFHKVLEINGILYPPTLFNQLLNDRAYEMKMKH